MKLPPLFSSCTRPSEKSEVAASSTATSAQIENLAATKIQRVVKGHLVRKHLRIKTVIPNSKILHVQIKGDSTFLEKIGMRDMNTSRGNKHIQYLSIPNNAYAAHLAGGKEIYRPTSIKGPALQKILSKNRFDIGVTAYINGGFYNSARLGTFHLPIEQQTLYPEHASIGASKVKGVLMPPSIPPQEQYAADYHPIKFVDGSYLTSGPLLADIDITTGKLASAFNKKKAEQVYYKSSRHTERPGQFGHAEQPHPRSAISLPQSNTQVKNSLSHHKTNNVRLAVANAGSGNENFEGLTMQEWSTVMRRLGSFNEFPGKSLNLDGGASTVMGVLDKNGKKIIEIRGVPNTTPTTTTFITYKQSSSLQDALREMAKKLNLGSD